jgi:hypothetical protein
LETVHLNKTSLYYPGREILEPKMNYESEKSAPSSMLPIEFAQEVYKAAIAMGSLHRVYAGTQAPAALSTMSPPERVCISSTINIQNF